MSLGVVNVLLACGWSFSSRSSASQPQRQQRHPHKDSHQQHEEVTTHVCDIGTTYASYHDASRLHTTSNTRSTTTTAKTSPCPPNTRSTTTTTTKRRQQQEGYNTHNNDEATSTTRGQSHPRHQNQHTDVAPTDHIGSATKAISGQGGALESTN